MHYSNMMTEQNINDPAKLAEACKLLGIDTTNKAHEQLQIECWKVMALNSIENVRKLQEMVKTCQGTVHTLVKLLEARDQDYQQKAREYAQQVEEQIKQILTPHNN